MLDMFISCRGQGTHRVLAPIELFVGGVEQGLKEDFVDTKEQPRQRRGAIGGARGACGGQRRSSEALVGLCPIMDFLRAAIMGMLGGASSESRRMPSALVWTQDAQARRQAHAQTSTRPHKTGTIAGSQFHADTRRSGHQPLSQQAKRLVNTNLPGWSIEKRKSCRG